jgi:hypothetical protein
MESKAYLELIRYCIRPGGPNDNGGTIYYVCCPSCGIPILPDNREDTRTEIHDRRKFFAHAAQCELLQDDVK